MRKVKEGGREGKEEGGKGGREAKKGGRGRRWNKKLCIHSNNYKVYLPCHIQH